MTRLKVAVIVKNTPTAYNRQNRNMGMWSYDVPEFEWEFLSPGKYFRLDTRALQAQGYDLVFHEDGGNWGVYAGGKIPVIYYSIDSTLSDENHYRPRYEQGGKADLVLIDHDKLDRFQYPGVKSLRFSYCVNDHLFKPLPGFDKGDICFHCGGNNPTRALVREMLDKITGQFNLKYRSGTVDLALYAYAMGTHKIVVNIPRNPYNRPHRIMDAMACHACVLSMPFPHILGENFIPGLNYALLPSPDDLQHQIITRLLPDDHYSKIAAAGYSLVMTEHTWKTRASQLRSIISKEFSI